jgi:hypothetical protein
MFRQFEQQRADAVVVRQAAAIASAAVGKIVMQSLRAAEMCGCRRCQRAAAETTLWAVTLREPSEMHTSQRPA